MEKVPKEEVTAMVNEKLDHFTSFDQIIYDEAIKIYNRTKQDYLNGNRNRKLSMQTI